MKLKELELHNFGLIEHLKMEFGDGLIGLFGPQGSGKSTSMNGVYFALTNDCTRIQDTKGEVVRQQAEPHELSQIRFRAEHHGNEFSLTRTLAPKTINQFQLGDYPPVTNQKLVQQEVDKLLGASRSLLGTHVFVEQWELRRLFQQLPSERAETLSQLAGTKFVQAKYDAVKRQLDLDIGLLTLGTEDLDRLRQELGEYQNLHNQESKVLERLRKESLTPEDRQAFSDACDKYRELKTIREELPARRTRLAEYELKARATAASRQAITNTLAEKRAASEAARELKETVTRMHAAYATDFARFTSKQRQAQRLAELEVEIEQAKTPTPSTVAETVAELDEVIAKLAGQQVAHQTTMTTLKDAEPFSERTVLETVDELDAKLAELLEATASPRALVASLKGLPDAANCPTCGQSLADVAASLAEAEQLLASRRPEQEELQRKRYRRHKEDQYVVLQGAREAHAAIKTELQPWLVKRKTRQDENLARDHAQINLRMLEEESQRITTALTAFADVVEPLAPSGNVAELTKQSVEADRMATAAQAAYDQAVQNAERAQAAYNAEKSMLATDEKRVQVDTLSDEEYATITEALEKDRETGNAIAGSWARVDEYNRVIVAKQEAIAASERIQSQREGAKRWTSVLSRTMEVLHRDGLPKKVHRRVLRTLETSINEMLAQFESTFRVTTDEDLGYVAHFFDGTVTKDKRLSGGQQVVLSLAFRWSLNSLFANEIGMLVLDEPTAGLDQRHLELLEQTLLRLGAAAKSRGYQVFIITHETRLRGVFDQVVDLGRAVA